MTRLLLFLFFFKAYYYYEKNENTRYSVLRISITIVSASLLEQLDQAMKQIHYLRHAVTFIGKLAAFPSVFKT